MLKQTKLFICATALVAVTIMVSCKRDSAETQAMTPQANEETPEPEPQALPGLGHGLLQSPVNILSDRAEGERHRVAVNFHHAEPAYLENKGHTIELDFPRGSSITFDGKKYQLKQVHFHTPSEHQIDGITYPMEVHVVNMLEPTAPEDPPRYLVLSFLFRMGKEDRFIQSFLDQVPDEEGGEALEAGKVYIAHRDRNLRYQYYHYRGSLTTPPYTETVEWLIVKGIQEASPEQIRRIHLIEGDNARRVQALYGRTISD